MPALLAAFQVKAYAALSDHSKHPFFLRKCLKDHALWASDFPRQHDDSALQSAMHSLRTHGFSCEIDPSSRLLLIDLTTAGYEALLTPLPRQLPTLPIRDALHSAYALCRLLFGHPSPLSQQPISPLRAVLKACDSANPDACLRLISGLHKQCAAWLREGRPLPHAAGILLCDWLSRQNIICANEGGVLDDP